MPQIDFPLNPTYDPGADFTGAPPWLNRILGGVVPGGRVLGYPASSTYDQTMGYPALGQRQGAPAQSFVPGSYPGGRGVTFNTPPMAPGGAAQPTPTASGLSLNSNPFLARLLNAINPIGSAQAGELPPSPNAPVNVSPDMPHGSGPGPLALQPGPAPAMGPPGYLNNTSAIPQPAALPAGFDVGGPNWVRPPTPAGTRANANATHAAAPPGNPSATPRPGAPNLGYYRPTTGIARGQATWVDPSNPANVPAPNAQPVSSMTRGNGTINLPANYNFPGSGYYMTPQGDVGGTLWGRGRGRGPYNPY